MYFTHFPLDIQIEILKYNPLFRGVNKTFYDQGYHMFKMLYSNLPITQKEYINYAQIDQDIWIYNANLSEIKIITKFKHDCYRTRSYAIRVGNYYHLSTGFHKTFTIPNDYLFDIETTFNIYQLRNLPVTKSDIIKKHLLQDDTLHALIRNMVYINGLNGLCVLDGVPDKRGEDYINYIDMMSKY